MTSGYGKFHYRKVMAVVKEEWEENINEEAICNY